VSEEYFVGYRKNQGRSQEFHLEGFNMGEGADKSSGRRPRTGVGNFFGTFALK